MLQAYRARVADGTLDPDPWQQQMAVRFDRLALRLIARHERWSGGQSGLARWLTMLRFRRPRSLDPSVGLYVWGGVGRGKTYLLDLFFDTLPFQEKLRLHFHRFMRLVHDELNVLADREDPLAPVADRFASRAMVLCLDELHVEDIADAMLLGRLFRHLVDRGVTLVVTANVPPHRLYHDGLQRARFLPAIELLERFTEVVELRGEVDHRLRLMARLDRWLPADAPDSEARLARHFAALRGVDLHADRNDIIINHRRIPVKMWADDLVWFDFAELCASARNAADYGEIATYFHTVMISGIPVMTSQDDDLARRFINMIDEFYERRVNLIASAAAAPAELYTGERLADAFRRTASRLVQMQSEAYAASRDRRIRGVGHGQ